MKAAVAILAILCIVLGAGWLMQSKKAREQKKVDTENILALSNQWVQVKEDFNEQSRVNAALNADLKQRTGDLAASSNQVTVISTTLAKVEAEKQAALEEIAKRDTRIAEMETQREGLTKQMTELNSSITTLESQIADTERKLAAAEGDRAFLLKELKRLQEEKAALERQFNDLAVLREQVRKLRDELSLQRRLDWIRKGLYGATTARGGAGLLQREPAAAPPQQRYDLNVELRRDAPPKIQSGQTNAPATTNAAPAKP